MIEAPNHKITTKKDLLDYYAHLLSINGVSEDEIREMLYNPKQPIRTVDDIAANILRIEREEEQNIPAPSVTDHKKSSLLSKIGKIFKK